MSGVIKRLRSIAKNRIPDGRLIDGAFAIAKYVKKHRRLPRVRDPRLFNEHLMRLKIDGSLLDPLHQYVTDKEYVKEYVAGVVGAEYVVETYDVLRSVDQVANLTCRRFPCVVKPTHMSGALIICEDDDKPLERDLLTHWLHSNYYRQSREANYRFLRPKVIVEEFFSSDGRTAPADYKVFCFGGSPRIIEVDRDRFRGHTRNFYDAEWERLQIAMKYPGRIDDDPKPKTLGTMLSVARELSRLFRAIRVDMYSIGSQVKVGELTSCHGSAGERIWPAQAEQWLGELFSKEVAGVTQRLRGEFYDASAACAARVGDNPAKGTDLNSGK